MADSTFTTGGGDFLGGGLGGGGLIGGLILGALLRNNGGFLGGDGAGAGAACGAAAGDYRQRGWRMNTCAVRRTATLYIQYIPHTPGMCAECGDHGGV